MKFYVIMRYKFRDEISAKAYKKEPKKYQYRIPGLLNSDCVTDDPSNHFPGMRIKMHELQKKEADKTVVYRVMTTNY